MQLDRYRWVIVPTQLDHMPTRGVSRSKLALLVVVAVPVVSTVSVSSPEAPSHHVCIDVTLDVALDPMPELDLVPTMSVPPGWHDDEDFPAAHRLARVVAEDGTILTGWHSLDAAGCTESFQPGSATAVDVYLLPWAYWGLEKDTSVVAYDCRCCDATGHPTGYCAHDEETAACGREAAVGCGRLGARILTVALASESDTTLATLDAGPPHSALEASLWAATRAEDQLGHHPHQTAYVALSDTWPSDHSDWGIGGRATTYLLDRTPIGRFTVAHEYGHGQAVLMNIPRDRYRSGMIDCSLHGSCGTDGSPPASEHTIDQPELQSCAFVEAMAAFYALTVWHELPDGPLATGRLPYSAGGIVHPIGCREGECEDPSKCAAWVGTVCATEDGGCGCEPEVACVGRPGLAIELDWASALLDFRQRTGVSELEILELMRTLLADADAWPTRAEPDEAFWSFVDRHARAHFGPEHAATWDEVAARWRVAQ